MRLCVHHRDFMVGEFTEESIINAIERSRRTIVLLSRRFVQSEWCEFEYRMARVRSFEQGRNIIIPVIMTELPAAD